MPGAPTPTPYNPSVYDLYNFTGPHLYLINGSFFDTHSFLIDHPSSTSSTFRFDFHVFSWEYLALMLSPCDSFSCATIPSSGSFGQIIVAGGDSRHTMFSVTGTQICSMERYDIVKDQWEAVDALPGYRVGYVGFVVRDGREKEKEFWVMGRYGGSRTISRVFPVYEYCRDIVVIQHSILYNVMLNPG